MNHQIGELHHGPRVADRSAGVPPHRVLVYFYHRRSRDRLHRSRCHLGEQVLPGTTGRWPTWPTRSDRPRPPSRHPLGAGRGVRCGFGGSVGLLGIHDRVLSKGLTATARIPDGGMGPARYGCRPRCPGTAQAGDRPMSPGLSRKLRSDRFKNISRLGRPVESSQPLPGFEWMPVSARSTMSIRGGVVGDLIGAVTYRERPTSRSRCAAATAVARYRCGRKHHQRARTIAFTGKNDSAPPGDRRRRHV